MKPLYGLCCISLALKERGIWYRTMTAKAFLDMPRKEALIKLSAICIENVNVLFDTLRLCREKDISRYRIPSDIFPLITYLRLGIDFDALADAQEITSMLSKAGEFAKNFGIGVSMHPSQYVVLASLKDSVRRDAAAEINFNARILDMLNTPADWSDPINIHLNSSPLCRPHYGEEFDSALGLLSISARGRIVVENEDKGHWNVPNLLEFLKSRNIPLSFDFLHHMCNSGGMDTKRAFLKSACTWGKFTPIFHYSESLSASNPRAHSDYCEFPPPDFGKKYFCMIEAKAKDFAIERLMKNG